MQASGAPRRGIYTHVWRPWDERATPSAVTAREGGRSSIPETPMMESRGRGVLDTPHARGTTTFGGGASAQLPTLRPPPPSQLPRIGKPKRAHPSGVLVQNQRAGDRRLGALAAVFAFAEPAVDADRRALGFFQVHSGCIDQARGMADFATEPDGKPRLGLRVRRHRAAHHLR